MRTMKYALVILFVLGCGSAAAPRRMPAGGEGGGGGEGGAGGDRPSVDAGGGGGVPAIDAAPPPADLVADLAPALQPDMSATSDLTPSTDVPAPLAACAKPSVDHLEIWEAHGGSLRPAVGGNLLVKEGDRHYAKVDFLPGGEWHEIVVPIVNSLAKKTDLSNSKGFTITYSATAALHVQLRPLSHPHGGEQWTAAIPATGGAIKELFIPFAPEAWGMLLGDPPFPFAQALRDANFFNFVGEPATANSLTVRGLRIDGFVPPCS
jgi:hypothetical protein